MVKIRSQPNSLIREPRVQRFYMIILAVLLLGACAFNPVGTWKLQSINSKFTPLVTVQNFGDGNYYMHGSPSMDGIYRINGSKFLCEKPDNVLR